MNAMWSSMNAATDRRSFAKNGVSAAAIAATAVGILGNSPTALADNTDDELTHQNFRTTLRRYFMRLHHSIAAGVVLSASFTARADTVTLTFANPVLTGAPGQTLNFIGTVSAPASNTGPLTLDLAQIAFPFGPSGFIVSTFGPGELGTFAPGDSRTVDLVDVTILANDLPGLYTGSFSEGIHTSFDFTEPFTVQVVATPPELVAPTPEPSSFALLGTGLLGIAGVLKRRFA